MRKDMNEIIIEVVRAGGGSEDKGKKKSYQREAANDYEGHATREKIKQWHRSYGKIQGDRLNPLRRYLKKHVGRNWDDVYSEICAVNDKRKLISYHLLSHLETEVVIPGTRQSYYRFQHFFVDTDGTLQETKLPVRKEEKRPVENIPLDDGTKYSLVDGIWYRIWTEEYLVPYSEEYLAEENGEVVIKRTPQKMVKKHRDFKFQCGKKELSEIREYLHCGIRKIKCDGIRKIK